MINTIPKAPPVQPPGWTYFGFVPAIQNWNIDWLDANGSVTQSDPIVGFIFWQDANLNFRCDPMAWYGPIFYAQQTTPYRITIGNDTDLNIRIFDPSRGY